MQLVILIIYSCYRVVKVELDYEIKNDCSVPKLLTNNANPRLAKEIIWISI